MLKKRDGRFWALFKRYPLLPGIFIADAFIFQQQLPQVVASIIKSKGLVAYFQIIHISEQ